jgi:hypothetical protein
LDGFTLPAAEDCPLIAVPIGVATSRYTSPVGAGMAIAVVLKPKAHEYSPNQGMWQVPDSALSLNVQKRPLRKTGVPWS